MASLSGGAVVALMHQAGFPESAWRVGAAIAYAESSWKTELTNQNSDSHSSTDYGLWQINDYWHPTEMSLGDWRRPSDNTRMAKKIYDKTGQHGRWNSWVTYENGTYEQYLSKADQAIQEHRMKHREHGESATGPSTAADEELSGETGTFSTASTNAGFGEATETLANAVEIMTNKDTWIRIGMATGGLALIGIGIVLIIKDLPGVKKAAGLATDLLPQTKALKAIGGKKKKRGSSAKKQSTNETNQNS